VYFGHTSRRSGSARCEAIPGSNDLSKARQIFRDARARSISAIPTSTQIRRRDGDARLESRVLMAFRSDDALKVDSAYNSCFADVFERNASAKSAARASRLFRSEG
jgi:hypothetical protein